MHVGQTAEETMNTVQTKSNFKLLYYILKGHFYIYIKLSLVVMRRTRF